MLCRRRVILDWVLAAIAVVGLAGTLLTGCDRTIKDSRTIPGSIR